MAIYELDPENGGNYFFPDQSVPEAEKTPTWFVDNIRYICTFYNRWARNAYVLEQPNDPNTATATNYPNEDPVQYMLRMMMYYLGRQPNLDYSHLNNNITTSNLMPDWIRGQKIYSILTLMKDNMLSLLENADFDVKPMSEEAQAERKIILDGLMIQHELRDFMESLKDQGVEVSAAQGQDFKFPEDIEYWMDRGYKDIDSTIMTNIARNSWLFNNSQSKFLNAFMHANTAGRCGIEHYVENGNYYQELHMPHNLIVDTRIDDDYNRRARFVGTVAYKTPDELVYLYQDWTDEQKRDLRKMAYDSNMGAPYNTMQNLVWWNYTGAQQSGTVAVVKGYWITLRDLRRKKSTNNRGIEKITKISDSDKTQGDYIVEDVCKATLIGNKYLVDYGYVDNVVEDYYNKSRPKLPIMVYMPNMILGESRSITSRLHELQDERDAYKFKIREMIGRSKGKTYLIKGWKLGNGSNTRELLADLSSMGIHVATHSGEVDGMENNERMVETVDMTMDPNVMAMADIIARIDMEMMEVAKVSDVSLGRPQKYMGRGVLESTMKNTSGSAYMYTGFMDYIQMNMQYAVDVCKYIFAEDQTEFPQMIIGRRGVEYLRLAKKMKYSNPLVFLTINDFIDQKQKDQLMQDAHAALQNRDIRFIDLLHITRSNSYTELIDKLELSAKRNDMQKEHEKAMEMQIKQLAEQNRQYHDQLMQVLREQEKSRQAQQKQGMSIDQKVVDNELQQQNQQPQ